jgi:hypothetical protein
VHSRRWKKFAASCQTLSYGPERDAIYNHI